MIDQDEIEYNSHEECEFCGKLMLHHEVGDNKFAPCRELRRLLAERGDLDVEVPR